MADIVNIFGNQILTVTGLRSIGLEWFTLRRGETKLTTKFLRARKDHQFSRNMLLKSYLVTCTLLIVIGQTTYIMYSSPEKISRNKLTWFTLGLFCVESGYFYFFRRKASDTAEFLNGLIQFDLMHGKKRKQFGKEHFTEMLYIYVTYAFYFTAVGIPPVFVFGIHWQYPWKVSLAGFWLIVKPTDSLHVLDYAAFIGSKFVVCLFNCWMWTVVAVPSVFVAAVIQNLSPSILVDNINV